jgi:aminomethyltransferase
MTLDYIPLEANLWDDVSFNKGCYTGQEIIARMESRGRLAKKLVQLQPAAPVEAGAVVRADDNTAGSVTSTAVGPQGPVALGYVRTNMLDGELTVGETAVTLCN